MCGRCNACNTTLTDDELTTVDTLTGKYTELCFGCRFISDHPDDVADYYDTKETNSEY